MGNCYSSHNGTSDSGPQDLQNPQSGPLQSPPTALPTLQDCIDLFKESELEETRNWDIKVIIEAVKQLCKSKSNEASTSTSHSGSGSTDLGTVIERGGTFLNFVNEHIEKTKPTDLSSGQGLKMVEEIFQEVGRLHWITGGLSIIAYLLNKVEQVSENKSQCLQLLERMIDLYEKIEELKDHIPEEKLKLKEASALIIEGCITCSFQLHSGKLFGFLKSSMDSQALNKLKSRIDDLYQELTLSALVDMEEDLTNIQKDLTNIQKGQPVRLRALLPQYPRGAVGLEKQLEGLKGTLYLQTTEVLSRVVVIYGLGGIGKTTLANALVVSLAKDLKDYNYTKLEINEEAPKNDFIKMQQQILQDCFPTYQSGREILLRNDEEGRNHITEAFTFEIEKPVFIFIDNALRSQDLKTLLPQDLQGLPHMSRILVTTRNLAVTDLFLYSGVPRHSHAVNPLAKENALQILCNDPNQPNQIINPNHLDQISNHVERIMQIAGGIPLVLKIIGAHLRKQKYKVENCSQIFEALEKGKYVKEDNLSERLVDFVYKELEHSTQGAFLDICSFFDGWTRRRVEYIVGVEEVTSLEQAALVTLLPFVNSITDIPKKDLFSVGEEKLIVHDVIRAKGQKMAEHQLQGIRGVTLPSGIQERQLMCIGNSLRTLVLEDTSMSAPSSGTFEESKCLYKLGLPMTLEEIPRLSFDNGPILEEYLSKIPENLKYLIAEIGCKILAGSKSIQAVRNSSLEELDLSYCEDW